jgi:oligosaccharide repeat unit polymerase
MAGQIEVDELKNKLSQMGSVGTNVGKDMKMFVPFSEVPDLGMEYLRRYRDVEIQYKILQFITPMYEQAKVEEKRQTPSVIVLDKAAPAERKSKPKASLWGLIGLVVSLLLSILIIFLMELNNRLRHRHAKEYEGLVRELRRDWFGLRIWNKRVCNRIVYHDSKESFHFPGQCGTWDEAAGEVQAMSWVSLVCFAICFGIIISIFRREADPLSPVRVFGFVWSLAIGLTELKLSALQHDWNTQSWVLLLIGIGAVLVGTLIAYVLNVEKELVPIRSMRHLLGGEEVREARLFWLICLSAAAYTISYLVIFLVKGWLPVFVVGTKTSRVEFNIIGFTVFLYSAGFIVFFTLLYYLLIQGRGIRKITLAVISLVTVGSYFLLLQRFQIIMAAMICFTLLYYATHYIRFRTAFPILAVVTAFFYWISSLRFSHVVFAYLYSVSKMRFSKDYAFLTEPYMYLVMNLENFAQSVNRLDHHTFGYFTFDFIVSITGLEKWAGDYFGIDRTPYLTSSVYNTYTGLWPFYRDFGVIGLTLIPLALGFSTGMLYYRMRSNPSIKSVTAYGMMLFVVFISFFVFPISFLWFLYNMLALYWILRLTMIPPKSYTRSSVSVEQR